MLPINQRTMEKERDMPANLLRMMMNAAQTLLIAIPVNNRLNAEICLRLDPPPMTRANTVNAPASGPIQVGGMPKTVSHPAAMTATAPSDAPVEIPSV